MSHSQAAVSPGEPKESSGESRAGPAGREPHAGGYSLARIVLVFLFSQIVGLAGGIALMLVLLAPLALPWWLVIITLGEDLGPLAILLTGAGFASGCFLHIQLPEFRARFLLLFFGNPAFLFFVLVAVNSVGVGAVEIPGVSLVLSPEKAARFAVWGAFCAVLGDRYAWRHKAHVGIG